MRVVITGATGNVGTSLVETLAVDPEVTSVLGLARRSPVWEQPKTSWASVDITHGDLTTHFRGADVVVHLAWIFQPTHDELATWRNNVLGGIRVFEAVAEADVPALVYASSIGAYAPRRTEEPVDESWPTHALPTAAYGREKSYLERVLDSFEREHPDTRVVRLRPGFIFKRESAAEQRRLFAGPFLPNPLVRPDLVPIVPDLPGLRLQALHTLDAAQAYRLAIVRPVRGAFNIAAEPVLDARNLGELLDARPVRMPARPLRAAISAAWHARLVPASPTLVDLALSLPVMDTARARSELGWNPERSSLDAIRELLEGLRGNAGGPTPPLERRAGGRLRFKEIATGVGQRSDSHSAGRQPHPDGPGTGDGPGR
jgi:nucleoside-diphosphate-sugar epimerase